MVARSDTGSFLKIKLAVSHDGYLDEARGKEMIQGLLSEHIENFLFSRLRENERRGVWVM